MHVVVNAATSADGKLSTVRREQVEISGPDDFARVDRLRAGSDAVVVGVGTVLADDPHLTVKDSDLREDRVVAGEPEQPARVVADSRLRTPADARVVDDAAPTYLLTSERGGAERRAAYPESVEFVTAGEERVDLLRAFAALSAEGIEEVMVEGGGELIFSLAESGLMDDLRTFVGPQIIGGRDAPTLADGEGFLKDFPSLMLKDVEQLDGGVLLSWSVER